MAKLFTETGEEVEAFTQEEFEAKQEEIKKEHEDALAEAEKKSQEAIDAAKAEHDAAIAELNTKLEETGLSDAQKKRLKEDKEEAEKRLKEVEEITGKKIKDLEDRIFGTHKDKLIKASAKDDETREKVKAKVETLMKTGDYENTEDGIARAVSDATIVVTGAKPQPGFMDNITGAGERGNDQRHNASEVGETTSSKVLRKNMGISDEDVQKFAPKSE